MSLMRIFDKYQTRSVLSLNHIYSLNVLPNIFIPLYILLLIKSFYYDQFCTFTREWV